MKRGFKMIGDKIKELRSREGINQAQLAEEIGISKMSISYFEQNKKSPSRETLQKIADYFKVTTDYLLGRSEDKRLTEEQDKKATTMGKQIEELISELPEEEQKEAWKQLEMFVHYKKSQRNI